jgi:hypothetical protein
MTAIPLPRGIVRPDDTEHRVSVTAADMKRARDALCGLAAANPGYEHTAQAAYLEQVFEALPVQIAHFAHNEPMQRRLRAYAEALDIAFNAHQEVQAA